MKIIQTDALLLALFVVITYSSDALTVRDDDDASSMDHHVSSLLFYQCENFGKELVVTLYRQQSFA